MFGWTSRHTQTLFPLFKCYLLILSFTIFIGKGEGIVIAPHVAGHLLGGTVWKITKDGEDVIYAVDFNRRKEKYRCYLLSDLNSQL